MERSRLQRYSCAAFGILIGAFHILSYHYTDVTMQLYDVFPQAWIFNVRPFIALGNWFGFWGPFPSWSAWLYGAVFIGIGVAGFAQLTYRIKLFSTAFLSANLVIYWVLYLWSEWGPLGELIVGDIGYTLLMGGGIALFNVGTPSPVASGLKLLGSESAAAPPGPNSGTVNEDLPAEPTGAAEGKPNTPSPPEPAADAVGTDATRVNDSPVEGATTGTQNPKPEENEGSQSSPVPPTVSSPPKPSLAYEDIEKNELIGRGGNADVYHASVTAEGKRVEIALKEPRLDGTVHTETVERLVDEAETWQQLDDHDHIVDVVDYGAEPLPWIAMEYMDGGHLGERAGEIPFDQALWTAIATTEAVRHAHRRGVAHLDLKPANILFRTTDDGWDVPKVADWGLSKNLLEHSKSVEGLSPHYAAPEQFDGNFGPADDITDTYQLGAIFYELFTGEKPFSGEPFEVMHKIQNEDPTPPSEIADVPPALDEILLTAMATEKEDRYETVIYLRDELRSLRE